jgi:uncharacterized cupin superfamily protein
MNEPSSQLPPLALLASAAAPRARSSVLPEPFASAMSKREKRPLGEPFGLKNFGVNVTRLAPGAVSALLHRHTLQDEFVYVLEGEPTLITDRGEAKLSPGMCAGFPGGGPAHQLHNRTDRDVVVLEVGDRTRGDVVTYPNDDLQVTTGLDGQLRVAHKDGTPY